MKGRIERVAYIGWRGIEYEQIDLDPGTFTGLIGPSGAGKSTLVMCLDYALLPDRRALDIRPISDLQDPHKSGQDLLAARIHPAFGYAYVALDVMSRHSGRIIAGIHVRIEDGRGEFARWYIDNAPREMALQDLFRVVEGDEEYYPDFHDLKRSLATRGIDLRVCRTVGDYGQILHEAGVLPTNLLDSTDRSLYGKLIETTFRGGISAEVATKLKDYLLPEARRIPETITKLQECTNQVFSTRRALVDAKQQLGLLEATYGTGKAIVLSALCREASRLEQGRTLLSGLALQIATLGRTLVSRDETLRGLDQQIDVTRKTIESIGKTAQLNLKSEEDTLDKHKNDVSELKNAWITARDTLKTFKSGRKVWDEVAEIHRDRDPTWVEGWMAEEEDRIDKDYARISLNIENLQQQLAQLHGGKGDAKTQALARMLGVETLEQNLDYVSDSQARALEMGLGGLVDGVVGVTPDALANLDDTEDLPDLFWLGERSPSPPNVRRIGPWHVSAGMGGYVITSERRKAVFGSQARQDRITGHKKEIEVLSARRLDLDRAKQSIKERSKKLHENHVAVGFFIENRSRALELEHAADKAKEDYETADKTAAETKLRVDRLRAELFRVTQPHEAQLKGLEGQKNEEEQRRKQDVDTKAAKELEHQQLSQEMASLEANINVAQQVLEPWGDRLLAEARESEALQDDIYLIRQTHHLSTLGDALKEELPARVDVLRIADPRDVMSCVRLWPMLLEILRDRIAFEVADTDGADFIREMQQRRDGLGEKLRLQEHEVKIQVGSINAAIVSEIASQRSRIQSLSRLGEHLKFGNVTGIRINVNTHQKLLEILEGFVDQLPLFSDASKPVDEYLREFFEKAADLKYTGEELLDYRTYMDLVIEAKRADGGWEPATSLSGGESIGGGLAIALMLSRAMIARGDVKLDQITPLFAIDEVHRLDPPGQEMIVEFGRREGFQVFVTASALSPRYRCTLYMLNRQYKPEERLIVRGVEHIPKQPATLS
jgi:energy-coupling factor transporter ATP-binding protein EcfA2